MASELAYNPLHQVLVCKRCQTCIIPGAASVERHLRAHPHCLLGQVLKTHLAYAQTLTLRTVQELREQKPQSEVVKLDHLKVFDGFQCLLCSTFLTIHLPRMRRHMHVHGRKAKEHIATPLWRECRLQTYFTAGSRIDYFAVIDNKEKGGLSKQARDSTNLTQPEKDLFEKLEKDYKDMECDLEEQASIVHDSDFNGWFTHPL